MLFVSQSIFVQIKCLCFCLALNFAAFGIESINSLCYTSQDETTVNNTSESEVIQDPPQSPVSYYDSSKSFFDSISCEAKDRDKNRR